METEIHMLPEPWINREIQMTKYCGKAKHCGWKVGGESCWEVGMSDGADKTER